MEVCTPLTIKSGDIIARNNGKIMVLGWKDKESSKPFLLSMVYQFCL